MAELYDIVIIGGGPAGLTAGLYAGRAGMKTILLETFEPSGQAVLTETIENYPGFPDGINGFELVEKFKKQAQKFGLQIKNEKVNKLEKDKNGWRVVSEKDQYATVAVIAASGAKYKKMGVAGEDKFIGKGVSYCAVCDGALFKGKEIVIVGGGNAAISEALFLTRFASKLTVIHRRNRLRADKILQDRILANNKAVIEWESMVEEIAGEKKVENIRIKNIKTNEVKNISCSGVFIFIGLVPNTEFLDGKIALSNDGYILVNSAMETSTKGIFACGDCTKKHLRQVVTACGDGAAAAESARLYIEELKGIAYK